MGTNREKYFSERGRDLRKTGREKTWVASEIWDGYQEVIRRIVLGQKNPVIAAATGYTPEHISNIRNSPVVEERVALMQGAKNAHTVDLAREIQEIGAKAVENLKNLIETGSIQGKEGSPALIVKASESVVDRIIGKPVQTLQTDNRHMVFTAQDILAIKKRAIENGAVLTNDDDAILMQEVASR